MLHALAAEADASDVSAFVEEGRLMLVRLHAEGTVLGVALQEA